ncbi:unnamed protein product [Fusarium venenatum]|uniref:Uncharacterized protein n=1 Tax=Fusarium venenatum TaxID=56646 RepID=A0A2L2SZP1_9HYPO|nr:uncharacterized protein FVRRES_00146 [Fusarium venenatum]CEI63634.1 unnamed protein product [Fusarium venenatum]
MQIQTGILNPTRFHTSVILYNLAPLIYSSPSSDSEIVNRRADVIPMGHNGFDHIEQPLLKTDNGEYIH